MDFVEQRTAALLRKELEKVYKNEAYFYVELLDEDLKNLKKADGNSIYDMLKNPAFKEAYFKASTFKIDKIEGYLVYAQAENGKTQIFDLENMTTPGEMKDGKIRGFEIKDDDLIINTEKTPAGNDEIMVYFNTISKMNNFSRMNKDTFNVLTMIGQLKGPELIALCSVDTRANTWCDQQFYQRAIQRDFPDYQIPMPMNGSPDYKQLYREMWLPNNYILDFKSRNYDYLASGELEPVFYGIQTNHIVLLNYLSFFDAEETDNAYIRGKTYYLGLTHEGDFVMKPVINDGDGSQDRVIEVWNKHEQSFFNPPKDGLFANARQFLNMGLTFWIVTSKGEVYIYNRKPLPKYIKSPQQIEKPKWTLVMSRIKEFSKDLSYALTEGGSLMKITASPDLSNFPIKPGGSIGVLLIKSDIKKIDYNHIIGFDDGRVIYVDKSYQLSIAYFKIEKTAPDKYVLKTSRINKPRPEDGNKFQIRSIIKLIETIPGPKKFNSSFQPYNYIFRCINMTNQIKDLEIQIRDVDIIKFVDRGIVADYDEYPEIKRKRVMVKYSDYGTNAAKIEFERGPASIIKNRVIIPTMFRNIKYVKIGRTDFLLKATRSQ